jgi:catechol 2,3-dioxygenase-like lactoylglutathione lyase family enzyme
MIKRIKFLGIPVRDQDRALAFYTEKLGFRILTDQQFSEKQRWIELSIPGADTGIVLFTPEGHEDRIGTFVHTSWEVDNIETTFSDLQAKGVEFKGRAPRKAAVGNIRDHERLGRESDCPQFAFALNWVQCVKTAGLRIRGKTEVCRLLLSFLLDEAIPRCARRQQQSYRQAPRFPVVKAASADQRPFRPMSAKVLRQK